MLNEFIDQEKFNEKIATTLSCKLAIKANENIKSSKSKKAKINKALKVYFSLYSLFLISI